MSAVDHIAETVKLARLLDVQPEALEYLAPLDAGSMRELRERISDSLFDDTRPMLERVAKSSGLLPNKLLASIGQRSFGAMLCARITGLLSAERAAAIATHMPVAFLADVSMQLDPRSARDVIAKLSTERVVAVAEVLLDRREHVTMGRFVDYLALDTIAAVITIIDDPAVLLDIAFYIEDKARISDLAGLLGDERLRDVVLSAGEGDGSTWVAALALMSHMNEGWRRKVGDVVVGAGDTFTTRLVDAAHTHDLWDAMLPVVESMSTPARHELARLPAIARPEVLRRVAEVATERNLWPALLPLVGELSDEARAVVAHVAEALPEALTLRIIDAAHTHTMWRPLLAMVSQMSDGEARQAVSLLARQDDVVLLALLDAIDGEGLRWDELLPHLALFTDDELRRLGRVLDEPRRVELREAAERGGHWARLGPLVTP